MQWNGMKMSGNQFTKFFNSDWEETDPENAVYARRLTYDKEGVLWKSETFEKDDPELAQRGGAGSGNYGHAGRPGKVGGSSPRDDGVGGGAPAHTVVPEFSKPNRAATWARDNIPPEELEKIYVEDERGEDTYLENNDLIHYLLNENTDASRALLQAYMDAREYNGGDLGVSGVFVSIGDSFSAYDRKMNMITLGTKEGISFRDGILRGLNQRLKELQSAGDMETYPWEALGMDEDMYHEEIRAILHKRDFVEWEGYDPAKYHSMFTVKSAETPGMVFRHEYGHKVHWDNYSMINDALMDKYYQDNKYRVTMRAEDAWGECVAENFALYLSGQTDKVDQDFIDVFDQIREKNQNG